MKKKLILASMWMLAITAITVVSCSKDEELEDLYSLDVSSRTPVTRSTLSDFEGANNTYTQTIKKNKSYTHLQNCCGITTLVDAWIKSKSDDYFSRPDCYTAQQYCDKLIAECKNDISYHWTPDSASMPISTLMKLNERFPIGKQKDGTPKCLYSGYETFENQDDVSNFFNDGENRSNTKGILLQDVNGKGHIAYVTSCTSKKVKFSGFDIFNPSQGDFSGASISTSGEKGWKIVGVIMR